MSPIRLYFPKRTKIKNCVPAAVFTKKQESSSTQQQHLYHDPQWESLIQQMSESYEAVADDDKCKFYIAQGIITEMQKEKPTGRFYQLRGDDSVLQCLSQEEMLDLTQKALLHQSTTQAASRRQRKPQTLDELLASKNRRRLIPTPITNDVGRQTFAVNHVEKLRKKFVSILRVLANGSLTSADQSSQIKTIAEDAIASVMKIRMKQDVGSTDDESEDDDDSAAAPRRREKQPRLLPQDYFSSVDDDDASEMACDGTVATKLLDNGLLASIAQFEPNYPMASCRIVRNLKIKGDRWYTGSVLYQRPHGIGVMKYKDDRIICGNW